MSRSVRIWSQSVRIIHFHANCLSLIILVMPKSKSKRVAPVVAGAALLAAEASAKGLRAGQAAMAGAGSGLGLSVGAPVESEKRAAAVPEDKEKEVMESFPFSISDPKEIPIVRKLGKKRKKKVYTKPKKAKRTQSVEPLEIPKTTTKTTKPKDGPV